MQELEIRSQSSSKPIDTKQQFLIKYGSAASEAMFDYPCHFFQIPDGEGFIPYRIESHCAVVFGEPLCPKDESEKLIEAFHRHCEASNLNIIYVIVSEKFAKWVKKHHCSILIESCKELIFDPQNNPCMISNRLRHRVEKAIQHGLTFHEYIPFDANIESALKEIGIKWQEAIKGPHIYLGHLNFFENYEGKRWFYVKDGECITSMIMLSKLDAHDGWLLKFLITAPHACHDTSEFLMTSVLDILRKENCRFLSKGMITTDHLGEIKGLGTFSQWCFRSIYSGISWAFKFRKRKEYWMRYHPEVVPTYLVFCRPHIGINEIKALTHVFKTSYTILHH